MEKKEMGPKVLENKVIYHPPCSLILMSITDYHGNEGPVKFTDTAETPTLTEALLKAAEEIGDPLTDVNGKQQKGKCSESYHILPNKAL